MGILSKPFVEAWINRYQDYVPLWPAKDTDQTSRRRRLRGLTVLAISVLVVILVPLVFFGLGTADAVVREGGGAAAAAGGANGVAHSGGGSWRKPDGLMVVALVFYGRRANVQILERYLRVASPQSLSLSLSLSLYLSLFLCWICWAVVFLALLPEIDGRKIWWIMGVS
jgi:Na+/proline symporter